MKKHKIKFLIVLFSVFFFLVGFGMNRKDCSLCENTSTSEETVNLLETKEPTKNKSWVELTEFTGNSNVKTDTFTVTGEKFRVSWNCSGDSNFIVKARRPDNAFDFCGIANTIGSNSNITHCYSSGNYYIDIMASGEWSIIIEEYK